MDELIARTLAGEASDLDARRLERWRSLSVDNERVYREASRVWAWFGGAEETGSVSPPPDPEGIIGEAEARRRKACRRDRVRAALRSGWTLAAAALLVVTLGVLSVWRSTSDVTGLAVLDATVGSGDAVTMTLSDGTLVRTAAGSRLEITPATSDRGVRLEGRAFFAVAEGASRFEVETEAGSVAVTGTRFEVTAEGASARVVTVEGSVRLEPSGVEVGAGRVAYMAPGSDPRVVDHDDPWSLLEWEGGLLLFQGTPLGDAAREVGRHFGTPVSVDSAVAARRITAWFDGRSLEETVSALCMISGTSCSLSSGGVRIEP